MNATIARLTLSSLLARRRIPLLALMPITLITLAVTFAQIKGRSDSSALFLINDVALGVIVPLLAFMMGSGAITPEIEDGSILYLLTKPISRQIITATKIGVATALSGGVSAIAVFATAMILAQTAGSIAVSFAIAALLCSGTYVAIAVLLGVITRHAMVIGLGYVLVWEGLVAPLVPGAKMLSVHEWSLAIVVNLLNSQAKPLGVSSAVVMPIGMTLLVLTAMACTWGAGERLRKVRFGAIS